MTRLTLAARYRRKAAALLRRQTARDARIAHEQLTTAVEKFARNWNARMKSVAASLHAIGQQSFVITKPLVDALAPGTFLGDLLRVRGYEGQPEADRAQAASRLIRRYFPPKYVFYGDRWHSGVEEAFTRRNHELGSDFWKTWETLVVAHLFDAATTFSFIKQTDGTAQTVRELYDWVRSHLRRAVERELLGYTLDSHMREVFPDEELQEPSAPQDVLELADLRLDLISALASLGETPGLLRALFLHDVMGVDSVTLARKYGLRPATLRKRLSRIRNSLRKSLS